MIINREMLIKRLSEKSGYVQQDIRGVLKALDDVVLECFADADDEEEVVVQLVKGIRCGVKIMPERQRKDPRTQDDIICKAQTKPFARFSDDFREKIQTQYEEKKGG
jgi:nucleoid DNA-binding protein